MALIGTTPDGTPVYDEIPPDVDLSKPWILLPKQDDTAEPTAEADWTGWTPIGMTDDR